MTQLFVDLDGVCADMDAHYEAISGIEGSVLEDSIDWDIIRNTKDFYLNIPPMADLPILWERVRHHNPVILTGLPWSVEDAESNKRAWVAKHLGSDIPVICCRSVDKYLHGKPGDILIDDREKYKHYWVEMGGVWVTHTSAVSTLEVLETLGYVEYRKATFEFLGAKR